MWKNIPDFNYEISDNGEVRSLKFKRLLTASTDKDGYKYIGIRKEGDRKKYWFRISRLVAIAFCNPPSNMCELDVDHIDRDITNNNFTNLRWVTRTQNNLNRQKSAWKTNKTGELYITRYKNGYMVRVSNQLLKHRSWHTTLEDAIYQRNIVAGAV